jgi:membrane-associated protease RseP (regulator of RpoE activity)
MLGMPAATAYDVNFRFLGIPVRISPWFWLGALMLSPRKEPKQVLLFAVCALVSILVHEYGHGLMARLFGYRAQIALFALGGLCSSESERQTFGQRLAVLAAGPGAQLVLLGVVMLTLGQGVLGITWADQGQVALQKLGISERPIHIDPAELSQASLDTALSAYDYLFFINFMWPLLNLAPIWPLDGGQILHVAWTRWQGRAGARRAHIVSMVTAGLLAGWMLKQAQGQGEESFFSILFFGWFMLINYQMLQEHYYRSFGHGDDDEADWWRR